MLTASSCVILDTVLWDFTTLAWLQHHTPSCLGVLVHALRACFHFISSMLVIYETSGSLPIRQTVSSMRTSSGLFYSSPAQSTVNEQNEHIVKKIAVRINYLFNAMLTTTFVNPWWDSSFRCCNSLSTEIEQCEYDGLSGKWETIWYFFY